MSIATVPSTGAPGRAVHVQASGSSPVRALRRLPDEVRRAVLAGAQDVVVDLGASRSLPAAAAVTLLRANRRCRLRGGGVVVRAAATADLGLLVVSAPAGALTIERYGCDLAEDGSDVHATA